MKNSLRLIKCSVSDVQEKFDSGMLLEQLTDSGRCSNNHSNVHLIVKPSKSDVAFKLRMEVNESLIGITWTESLTICPSDLFQIIFGFKWPLKVMVHCIWMAEPSAMDSELWEELQTGYDSNERKTVLINCKT